jgi:hypothetical protein
VTAPRCRYCAKKLKKLTRPLYFGRARDSNDGWSQDFKAKPRTPQEAQRFSNQVIVSASYSTPPEGERYIYKASSWDGESYEKRHGYFCSINCAANMGQLMASKGWASTAFTSTTKGDPDT